MASIKEFWYSKSCHAWENEDVSTKLHTHTYTKTPLNWLPTKGKYAPNTPNWLKCSNERESNEMSNTGDECFFCSSCYFFNSSITEKYYLTTFYNKSVARAHSHTPKKWIDFKRNSRIDRNQEILPSICLKHICFSSFFDFYRQIDVYWFYSNEISHETKRSIRNVNKSG